MNDKPEFPAEKATADTKPHGERADRGPLSSGDLRNLEEMARACLHEGEGWRYGNLAPNGKYASLDEMVAEYEAYLRNGVAGLPEPLPDHALQLWTVWTKDGENNPLAIAVTGNGPTSQAHARAFVALPR